MNAMRNFLHGFILLAWACVGLLFTVKAMFDPTFTFAGFVHAASFWVWYAGLAAITTLLVARFAKGMSALLVHAGVLLVLAMIPRIFPLSLLRLGVDLLRG